MTGITPFHAKQLLDWSLGGATPTRPGARFISWATQSPTTQSDFEGPWTRVTFLAAAAGSPAGAASVSNSAAESSRATAIGTGVGWNIWDASSGGNRLYFGTTTSLVSCASSADLAAFAAGGLKIILS